MRVDMGTNKKQPSPILVEVCSAQSNSGIQGN